MEGIFLERRALSPAEVPSGLVLADQEPNM